MHIVIWGEEGGRAHELEQAFSDFGLDWRVEWLGDPAATLAAREAVGDVFVSDMMVNGLRGPELLSQVRHLHPGAIRILLLDRDQSADALQALDSAHRLQRKPLDAAELIEAVESVSEMRELLDSPLLKQAVGQIGSLPPPPRLFLELSKLLQDPEVGSAEVADLVSQDPALVAKVLRLCNSAYFSAGRVISDIRSAVTRLGLQTVQRLVLASEAFAGVDASNVDREAMQDRALRTSRLAAQILPGPSAELAATAGLLAEVGMLLPGFEPDAEDDGSGRPHYAEAGAYLLGLWGLPMPIVEAVAHHHRPGRMRMTGFWVAGAVHVASALVSGQPVDEDYLRAVCQLDKLPRWRALAEQSQQQAA